MIYLAYAFIQGVLLLLAPDWSVLTLPGAWLEAAAQVCQHPHQLMTKLGKLFFEIWPESLILKKLNLYERIVKEIPLLS